MGVEEENGIAKRPVKGVPEYMLDTIQKEMIGYNNMISPPYFPQGIPAEEDAKWIYDNCKLSTKVIINESVGTPFGKPTAYKLEKWHTWDPTDPNMAYKCKQRGCH